MQANHTIKRDGLNGGASRKQPTGPNRRDAAPYLDRYNYAFVTVIAIVVSMYFVFTDECLSNSPRMNTRCFFGPSWLNEFFRQLFESLKVLAVNQNGSVFDFSVLCHWFPFLLKNPAPVRAVLGKRDFTSY